MKKNNHIINNYTPKQLKLPIEIEKIIDFSDPVYSFCEIVDSIDLSQFFVVKGYKTGRPRFKNCTFFFYGKWIFIIKENRKIM